MKKYDDVPEYVMEQIKKTNLSRAALALQEMNNEKLVTLPVRPVKMAILHLEMKKPVMDMTIIPATDIYVKKHSSFDDQYLDRNGLVYYVANTAYAFPLAHVFKDSGHICLGNIFVPSKVPIYSPQQPLETLFLHNDRNLSHGRASLVLSEKKISQIRLILRINGIQLSLETDTEFQAGCELLNYDTIWKLSSEVLKQKDIIPGVSLMTQIFKTIWETKK